MSESEKTAAALVGRAANRETAKVSSGIDVVTVFCKMPTGVYIQAFRMVAQREPVLGGGVRDFHIAEPAGLPIKINGNRFRIGADSTHRITNDYGVTEGVSRDVWDSWLEANAETPMVKNGLIFAFDSRSRGEEATEEHRDVFTGLGPMGKDGDPRSPAASPNLTGIRDERAA